LCGDEIISIQDLETIKPLEEVDCEILYSDGESTTIKLKCRIDTAIEIEYVEHGGVLHYVLRNLAKAS
jgi:aconitate hydratase